MDVVEQGPTAGEASRLSANDYHNLHLPTPINAEHLDLLLSNYDPILRKSLVLGFREGFDIGFRGEVNCDPSVKNLKSTNELKSAVSEALAKEVLDGRIAGPFPRPPFPAFQLNPIGIVPKRDPKKI